MLGWTDNVTCFAHGQCLCDTAKGYTGAICDRCMAGYFLKADPRPWVTCIDCATLNKGEVGFCNCNTCPENEGDCDYNNDCQDGLFCGYNNCPTSLNYDSGADCRTSTLTTLVTPNYPNSYPNNAQESWLITDPTALFITLQFHYFHVRIIVEFENTIVLYWITGKYLLVFG